MNCKHDQSHFIELGNAVFLSINIISFLSQILRGLNKFQKRSSLLYSTNLS